MAAMSPHLSQRAKRLNPSATFALAKRAAEMQSRGLPVLVFGLGEPDFDTPVRVKDAAVAAIHRGETRYTANEGILSLRQAISDWLFEEQGVRYMATSEILVTAGAKQAIAHALLALVDPGDEVLLPVPYWVTYPELVHFCEGVVKEIPTRAENAYHLDPRDLERAITSKSRVLILNSPNNPTGAVLSKDELRAIADVVVANDLVVVSDEIYGPLVYGDNHHVSIAAVDPRMRDRTIVCHGMSKAFAMTGWRLGFAAAAKPLLEAMGRIQSHTTSNASSIAQHAAEKGVRDCRDDIPPMRAEFDRRRKLVLDRFSSIPGFEIKAAEGAFYAFPTIRKLFGKTTPRGVKITNSTTFCDQLLDEAFVSVVPGGAFGDDEAFRLSYAASYESLEEGCTRIARFVESLR